METQQLALDNYHHEKPYAHVHEGPAPPKHSHRYLMLADFVSGSFAGFACKVIEHPLDTVKVLLQTQHGKEYSGAVDCIKKVHAMHGYKGFYRGLMSPLVGSMAESAGLFLSYNLCKRMAVSVSSTVLSEQSAAAFRQQTFLINAIGAAGSGVCVSLVLTPVEFIKCQMQKQVHHAQSESMTPTQVVQRTLKAYGLGGLYRGQSATVLREIPGNVAWFSVYEYTRERLAPVGGSKDDIAPLSCVVAGACAGTAYWMVNYPADTIKSLIQTEAEYMNMSCATALATVYRRAGIRGLYTGSLITIFRAMPSNAALFLVYELFARKLFQI